MNMKKSIALLISVFFVSVADAAKITIQNNTEVVMRVQPIESREDEYRVGVFKYSVWPHKALEHNSWLNEIKGFRWQRCLKSRQAEIIICADYSVVLPVPISRFNTKGVFLIYPDGAWRYYPDKNNTGHYFSDNAEKHVYALVKDEEGVYRQKQAPYEMFVNAEKAEKDQDQWYWMQP